MDKVILICKSQIFLELLRKLLSECGFLVTGEVSTEHGTLQLLDESAHHSLRFIIVEGSFCWQNNAFLKLLRQKAPKSMIVLLANAEDVHRLSQESLFSFDGIISARSTAEILVQSLRLLQLGERVVSKDLIMSLLEWTPVIAPDGETSTPGDPAPPTREARKEHVPSRREAEILSYLVRGLSNKVIARRLGITEATVKVHLKGLLRKIRASNRTQAAVCAEQWG